MRMCGVRLRPDAQLARGEAGGAVARESMMELQGAAAQRAEAGRDGEDIPRPRRPAERRARLEQREADRAVALAQLVDRQAASGEEIPRRDVAPVEEIRIVDDPGGVAIAPFDADPRGQPAAHRWYLPADHALPAKSAQKD